MGYTYLQMLNSLGIDSYPELDNGTHIIGLDMGVIKEYGCKYTYHQNDGKIISFILPFGTYEEMANAEIEELKRLREEKLITQLAGLEEEENNNA